jgi:BASS family bile acid:Na+ symporter
MRLLRNNGFILALALAAGIALGQGAHWTRAAITPLLAVIMTLSLVGVSSEVFSGGRRLLKPAAIAVLLNYGLLGGALVLLAFGLLGDPTLRAGFVLIAVVPPAVAVIPFTYRLGGDLSFALVGSVAGHIAAFLLTPLLTVALLGSSLVEPRQLLIALLQLVALPFLVSRLLRKSAGVVGWLDRYRGSLINWGFFVVVYTIIGLNRSAFVGFSSELVPVAIISFCCTFGIAHAIHAVARLSHVTSSMRVSFAVMGAWKNYGLAGAIALLYFGEAAALPAAVTTAFAIANFITLNMTVAVRDATL